MRGGNSIYVIIPTLNEEKAIGNVIGDIPDWVDGVIVSDSGSQDDTVRVARSFGSEVVQSSGGYGSACLSGIDALPECDLVVFLDGDYSDYPEQMDQLVDPIIEGKAELVIGSRRLGKAANGSLTLQQKFGNWLACFLIHLFWRVRYTDLGPFRAVERKALKQLKLSDPAFGWTVQMQLHAIQENIKTIEVPVDYRVRIGYSKISGTLRGSMLAGYAIIGTILSSSIKRYFR